MSNGSDDVTRLFDAWERMATALTDGMNRSIAVSKEAWAKVSDESVDYDTSSLMADMARGYAIAVNSMRGVGAVWNEYIDGQE